MRTPLQSMRTVDDNELLLRCRRVHQGLAAICCVLIVACVTVQFTDVLAGAV